MDVWLVGELLAIVLGFVLGIMYALELERRWERRRRAIAGLELPEAWRHHVRKTWDLDVFSGGYFDANRRPLARALGEESI